jgi:hypothetical protein
MDVVVPSSTQGRSIHSIMDSVCVCVCIIKFHLHRRRHCHGLPHLYLVPP